MYDDYYEEYMRNVLGYGYSPDYRSLYYMMPQDLYSKNTYYDELEDSQMVEENIEEYYPDIYKTIYPKVKNTCMNNKGTITKELIDNMVDEIYSKIENNDSININVNVGNTSKINNVSTDRNVRSSLSRTEQNMELKDYKTEKRETRNKNQMLSDLIRILILRELENKSPKHGNMPPKRPRPPFRPPFSSYDNSRPPFRPRGLYDSEYNNYDY